MATVESKTVKSSVNFQSNCDPRDTGNKNILGYLAFVEMSK